MLTALLATIISVGPGQLPPPPVVTMHGSEWAANYDGRLYAGDNLAELVLLLIEGPDPPDEPANPTTATGCRREARIACNEGMPQPSPNALCGVVWIGSIDFCMFWCRNLDGTCPDPPALPTVSPTAVIDILIDVVKE